MTIAAINNWFKLAVPEPTDKTRLVQLGVHFEEVAEMLDALRESWYADKMHALGDAYKTANVGNEDNDLSIDRKELLDALCDQIVTAVGVAHMLGMNIEGALAEVNRSNYSKFVDGKPLFNEQGKIAKGPSYTKPQLGAFL